MRDFRQLIQYLKEKDKIIRVKKEVDPEFEMTLVASSIHKKYRKAVIFENVKGSKFPVNLLCVTGPGYDRGRTGYGC